MIFFFKIYVLPCTFNMCVCCGDKLLKLISLFSFSYIFYKITFKKNVLVQGWSFIVEPVDVDGGPLCLQTCQHWVRFTYRFQI